MGTMQPRKSGGRPVSPTRAKEKELASGCDLTVVTETAAMIHHDDAVANALRRGFDRTTPYDLLSVPSLERLLADDEQVETLAHDVMTAIDLHQVETVLVASLTASPQAVLDRLCACEPALKDRVLAKAHAVSRRGRAEDPSALVVTCMDWRLQGPNGFARFMAAAFDLTRYDVLATAGAGKELGHDTPRARMIAAQLAPLAGKGLKRVIVLSHTDCGKYGGNKAFPGPAHQCASLEHDLGDAAAALQRALPGAKIETGIIDCGPRAVLGVERSVRR